jgi:hypothetical protein
LNIAWHVFNRLDDYDPFLFLYQYRCRMINPPQGYISNWSDVIIQLDAEYYYRFKNVPRGKYRGPDTKNISELIWESQGIYHINTLNAINRTDTGYYNQSGYPCHTTTQCVDAEVLDVYKGGKDYSSCDPQQYELSQTTNCIRYSGAHFNCDTSKCKYLGLNDSLLWSYYDMQAGREYLVFTGYYSAPGSYAPGIYRWRVIPYMRFEISGGQLLDPLNYFQLGASVSYLQIENIIRDEINHLNGRE